MKRTLMFTILLTLMLPRLEQPAQACSCAGGIDPKKRLAMADAAFVGSLLSHEEAKPVGGLFSSATEVAWRFRIEQVVKGSLGREVDVQSPVSGVSCGFELQPGVTAGVLLQKDNGGWKGGFCTQISPEVLLQAAKPLPAPDGVGPATFLVGGSFGEARLLALDSKGRTLGYGKGDGRTLHQSVCPGAKRLVEVTGPDLIGRSPSDPSLDVRDLRTLEILSTKPLPRNAAVGSNVEAVSCLDEAGEGVLLFETDRAEPSANAAILKAQEGQLSTLASGDWTSATFDAKRHIAYMGGGKYGSRLETVNLSNGEKTTVTTVPVHTGPWVPSPDRKRLAAVAFGTTSGGSSLPSQFVLVDMTTGAPKTLTASLGRANVSGAAVWVDDKTVVFAPSGGDSSDLLVYDTSLKVLASFPGWDGRDPVLFNGTLFGVTHGTLQAVTLPEGPVREFRRFDSPEVFSLTALNPGIRMQRQAGEGKRRTGADSNVDSRDSEPEKSRSSAAVAIAALGLLLVIVPLVAMRRKRSLFSRRT